ncbi:cation:proton antiporter [Flavobacterium sp. MAH-1]|uniref:Cation:proton antiporter n=1 Tax=Flavobacterium agri TaxID=2743471 RepID=A0A7Y8Y0Z5_9FLAO|nr:cation:proton antiporter [Flavobacterium agri]NUY80575.1 cation:proton antiporter [Flavobacterium agri]NYA70599.1 cation:proton antiporter [Flavobacterium agri]
MGKIRNAIFYVATIGGFGALMYWIIGTGKSLEAGRTLAQKSVATAHWDDFVASMIHNLEHPLAILLAQIITIIFVARFFGWVSRKIGQPSVVGEIIAGVVLGPSLVGMYWPEVSTHLFPKESLGNLQFLSQIGLIFFMFVIGMELDLKVLRNKAHDAVVISHASIIFPFSLGVGLAYFIYERFAPAGVDFLSFALFCGVSMSITAFPVLARIVQERGIHKTRLGAIAITCAAADDITAWCILAVVIAIVKAGSITSAFYVIAMAIVYVILMINVVRPFLKRVGELNSTRESLSKPVVAIFLLTLIISAYVSEIIGIHALFGAFMAGVIMPESGKFRNIFIEKIEDVSVIVLLPLFFVFTGLRTQIGLLSDVSLLSTACWIVAIAVIGKFVGSTIAAKFVGQNWKDALSIGALMNTRGLMELVALNIGYDLGVLTPEIFTMMVLMALITTFMTGPSLDLINYFWRQPKSIVPQEIEMKGKYRILISFANSQSGKTLLRLASALTKKQSGNTGITALHLSLSSEMHSFDLKDYEKKVFAPILVESEILEQPVSTDFKVSNDINHDITHQANHGDYDLLLIGLGQSIFEGTILGKVLGFTTQIINPDRLIDKFIGKEGLFENSPFDERTRHIVLSAKMPVGIFLDKKNEEFNRIFLPVFSPEDAFLVEYAQKFIHNNGAQVTVLDATGDSKNTTEMRETVRHIEQIAPNHIAMRSDKIINKEFLGEQDLMLISLESWKKLVDSHSVWLTDTPSVLIIKP